jgi:DNA repair protein RadD
VTSESELPASVPGEVSEVDRQAAVGLLQNIMKPREVRDALVRFSGGSSNKSIEWIVAAAEHAGNPSQSLKLPDKNLIQLLMDVAGEDLLTDRELRRIIADRASPGVLEELHQYPSETFGRGGRATKVKAVAGRKWHPGKAWANHFVRAIGLPRIFAGSRGEAALDDALEVQPFVPLAKLADFQQDLYCEVVKLLDAGTDKNRAILTLPTGAGKTRTAVEALLSWWRSRPKRPTILWIAQSEELCEQAVQAFREVWVDLGHRSDAVRETLTIGRLWGQANADPLECGVVVASIQKLHAAAKGEGQELKKENMDALGEATGVIVIDEAHRALALSYTTVLGSLGVSFRGKTSRSTPLLGLTATPRRANYDETLRLRRRFHDRILNAPALGIDPLKTLRERKVLSRVVFESLDYHAPINDLSQSAKYSKYFENFEDVHPDVLKALGEEHERNRELVNRIRALDPTWPVLLFACSVAHAQAMSSLLQRSGRSSACITAKTRSSTRRGLIERFRSGEVTTLCNYGVLTTGFDAPSVRCVVVARPTASRILYEQMIGRGLRGPLFGGTEECLVIDVDDNIQWRNDPVLVKYPNLEREMRYAT